MCGAGTQAAALMGDPHALRALAVSSAPDGMGGLLPRFVTPGAVRELKARLSPAFASTNADVQACTSLAPNQRAAWAAFFAAWAAYRDSDEGFWSVTTDYDTGEVFEQSLSRWQSQLDGQCKLSAPRIVTAADATDLSPVKWAAVAVIAVALVWGVHTVAKAV